jgi:hypothetical protein
MYSTKEIDEELATLEYCLEDARDIVRDARDDIYEENPENRTEQVYRAKRLEAVRLAQVACEDHLAYFANLGAHHV